MTSLLERERLGGQVQCIYVDPPYGINYNPAAVNQDGRWGRWSHAVVNDSAMVPAVVARCIAEEAVLLPP